jgi:hypothetical protein
MNSRDLLPSKAAAILENFLKDQTPAPLLSARVRKGATSQPPDWAVSIAKEYGWREAGGVACLFGKMLTQNERYLRLNGTEATFLKVRGSSSSGLTTEFEGVVPLTDREKFLYLLSKI